MALIDDYALAQDGAFQARVKMALVSTALAVQSEATSVASHAARSAGALAVLAAPDAFVQRVALALTVDGAATSASTDAQLEARVSAVWNAFFVQG